MESKFILPGYRNIAYILSIIMIGPTWGFIDKMAHYVDLENGE